MTHEMKTPGPDHPITIEPSDDRVTVRGLGTGITLAESTATLVLREASYPPVRYIPLADVDRSRLQGSATTTNCPYKGHASYLSITNVDQGDDAVWFYDQPYSAVEPIRGHVAFYNDRVEIDVEPA
jgi:uncharacterized protein (DUF427 family)